MNHYVVVMGRMRADVYFTMGGLSIRCGRSRLQNVGPQSIRRDGPDDSGGLAIFSSELQFRIVSRLVRNNPYLCSLTIIFSLAVPRSSKHFS